MRILVLILVALVGIAAGSKHLIQLTEDNWRQLLQGEWMVKFYAPWCPACKDMEKTWGSFADWSKDLNIKVASIDVTKNAGLSGRFLVTALPTVYHVKDGVFRTYNGPRDREDFISFVEDKKWSLIDPVANWKHPDTPQMAVVAMFFRMSMSVRDLHNHLVEKKGLPPVASYMLFGVATLILGCILGFLIVCLIDVVFPARGPPPKPEKKDEKKKGKDKKDKKEEKARHSQSEGEASQTQSDADVSADESEVRSRKKEEKKGAANGKKPGTEGKKKK